MVRPWFKSQDQGILYIYMYRNLWFLTSLVLLQAALEANEKAEQFIKQVTKEKVKKELSGA